MKRFLPVIILALCAVCSCVDEQSNPYEQSLRDLHVLLAYPDGWTDFCRSGVGVKVENVNLGNVYEAESDAAGHALFRLPVGVYRVSVSDVSGDDIFNGSVDRVRLILNSTLVTDTLSHSTAGHIVIKEIYCGGCMKYPEQGTYQADQYVILHNNYPQTEYLDGLCFGCLAPYNSNASNPFLGESSSLPSYVPVIQAVWQFGGNGESFPLEPGEDAVVCLRGAIDHSAQYPLSVNLNRPGYFVCYNSTYFTNTAYHPAPGSNITPDRYLDVLIKTGQANAYTYSVSSPATVLFRAPSGVDIKDWLLTDGAVEQLPGSSIDRVVCVPPEWVCDAVEVFNGASSSNSKRLLNALDAGYVSLSGTFLGHSLFRLTDGDLSSQMGYEVLQDTNNSSADFYERETQSLHE